MKIYLIVRLFFINNTPFYLYPVPFSLLGFVLNLPGQPIVVPVPSEPQGYRGEWSAAQKVRETITNNVNPFNSKFLCLQLNKKLQEY